jgi:hypothetical protein
MILPLFDVAAQVGNELELKEVSTCRTQNNMYTVIVVLNAALNLTVMEIKLGYRRVFFSEFLCRKAVKNYLEDIVDVCSNLVTL